MNPKLIIAAFFVLSVSFLSAQTLQKLPPLAGLPRNTPVPRIGPHHVPQHRKPIVLFNNIEFKHYLSSEAFFDQEKLVNIRIYHRHSDSARLFGPGRKDVVNFITTTEIGWVSAESIVRQYAVDSSVSTKTIMLDINGRSRINAQQIYFDKSIIESTFLSSDTTCFYDDKKLTRVLFVKLSINIPGYNY